MPELPEVETTLRGIEPHMSKQSIKSLVVRQWQLRWPIPKALPKKVKGQIVRSLSRRGKYLLISFDHGTAIAHLGMSGSLRIVAADEPIAKHDHVDWQLESGQAIRFHDPRRFGALLWTSEPVEQHPLLINLGPEPLGNDFSAEYFFVRSRKRKQSIKTFIMDSKNVVGVGNIYANEALFLAGIRPGRRAGGISKVESEQLVGQIKHVLGKAIEVGGTTLRDFVGGDGKPGYFQQSLYVYGREGEDCRRCKQSLKHKRIGQRATVYCPQCQK